MRRILACLAALSILTSIRAADDSKSKADLKSKPDAAAPEELGMLLDALKGKKAEKPIHVLTGALDQRLHNKETAAATATRILERTSDFGLGAAAEKRVSALTTEKQNVIAAQLLLQCVKAKLVCKSMNKGGVAFGRVAIEDGKLDTEWVMAQMPILPGGYFAGEVGDMTKPIHFRAAGYEDATAEINGKAGDIVDVGTVTLKPMAKEKAASVKGKVALDIAERGPATASISLMVPPPNTPHNGYSPRRRWPQPTKVAVETDGTFMASGLTPGQYYLQVQAKDHTNVAKVVKVEAGKEADQGTLKLRTTDLGYYIGKPAPKGGELAWEKDFKAAMARAESEKKPVMLMLTATWCGWCKKLEADTFNDPWVKHLLGNFVIVKAYEEKEVEAKYPQNGYPTLVFIDAGGKEVHRFAGYKQTLPFLGDCVQAFKKLAVKLPEELQTLVDKKVLGAEESRRAPRT